MTSYKNCEKCLKMKNLDKFVTGKDGYITTRCRKCLIKISNIIFTDPNVKHHNATRFDCICGGVFTVSSKLQHLTRNIHNDYVRKINSNSNSN